MSSSSGCSIAEASLGRDGAAGRTLRAEPDCARAYEPVGAGFARGGFLGCWFDGNDGLGLLGMI